MRKSLGVLPVILLFLAETAVAYPTVDIGSPPSGTSPAIPAAAGNDSANDEQSFANALTYLASQGGGTLQLDAGKVYRIEMPDGGWLTVPDNVTITGPTGGVMPIVRLDSTSTSLSDAQSYHELFHIAGSNVTLSNFEIIRTTAAQYSGANNVQGIGVYVSNQSAAGTGSSGLSIQNVVMDGGTTQNPTASDFFAGIKFGGDNSSHAITGSVITGCEIRNCQYGLYMEGQSGDPNSCENPVENTTVSDSYFHDNWADDLQFNAPAIPGGWQGITVQNCTFANNHQQALGSGFGVGLANCQGGGSYPVIVEQCRFSNYYREAIHVEDRTSNFTITQNMFTDCGTATNAYGIVFVIESSTTDGTVSDNYFDARSLGQATPCIYLGYGTDWNGSSGTAGNMTISDNTFLLGYFANGVEAYSSWYDTITNNLFQGYGSVDGSGNYSGGANWGIDSANAGNSSAPGAIITDNSFSGLTRALNATQDPSGIYTAPAAYAHIYNNELSACRYAIDAQNYPAAGVDYGSGATANVSSGMAAGSQEAYSVSWCDEGVPSSGAFGDTDGWNWVGPSSTLSVFSGSLCHESIDASAGTEHDHYFLYASPITPTADQTLYAWVRLDESNKPDELLLGWADGSGNWYRAYWGNDDLTSSSGYGSNGGGANNRAYAGPLPDNNGGWTLLQVTPAALGLPPGTQISGMSFNMVGGHAWWDRAGLLPAPPAVAPGFSTAQGSAGPTGLLGGFDGAQNVTGQQCTAVTGCLGGTCPIYVSGTPTASNAYAYANAFSVGGIPITANTKISYWIYPTTPNGRYVGIDFLCGTAGFFAGPDLRDSGAVDLCGYSMHPHGGHGGAIPLNQWTHVICDVGDSLFYFQSHGATQITKIWIGYDQPTNDGAAYGAYIDDIVITDGNP